MDSMAGGGVGEGFQRFDIEDREQREQKMRSGRFRLGLLTLFRGLQEKTTAHGLPHVHNARGTCRLQPATMQAWCIVGNCLYSLPRRKAEKYFEHTLVNQLVMFYVL